MNKHSGIIFFLLLASISIHARESNPCFTVVELCTTYDDPKLLSRQVDWIVENASKRNLKLILHTGDLTRDNTDTQWTAATQSLSRLENHIPLMVASGNHDTFPGTGRNRPRNAALFNQAFPITRFVDLPCYGGHFEASAENMYYLFEEEAFKLLVLALEFAPRDKVLAWANEVASQHPNHQVVVMTHCYLGSPDSKHNYSWHPLFLNWANNNRDEIWHDLIRKHKNISLVLSAHYKGQRRETSLGNFGNPVHQLLTNYLEEEYSHGGWLRLIDFYPSDKRIEFKTYSPILNRYLVDGENQFSVHY